MDLKQEQQEMFNKAWNFYLVEKNPPGWSPGYRCPVYRGPGGCRCAAGLFFTDEEYALIRDSGNAHLSLDGLLRRQVFPKRLVPYMDLLTSLQWAHDTAALDDYVDHADGHSGHMNDRFREILQDRLKVVARRNKLEVPEAA